MKIALNARKHDTISSHFWIWNLFGMRHHVIQALYLSKISPIYICPAHATCMSNANFSYAKTALNIVEWIILTNFESLNANKAIHKLF